MVECEVTTSEIMEFLKEHMVTKADLDMRGFATKKDLLEMQSEIMTHIDGLAKRTETFDHELFAMQSKYNRLEERLEVIEHKLETV